MPCVHLHLALNFLVSFLPSWLNRSENVTEILRMRRTMSVVLMLHVTREDVMIVLKVFLLVQFEALHERPDVSFSPLSFVSLQTHELVRVVVLDDLLG